MVVKKGASEVRIKATEATATIIVQSFCCFLLRIIFNKFIGALSLCWEQDGLLRRIPLGAGSRIRTYVALTSDSFTDCCV